MILPRLKISLFQKMCIRDSMSISSYTFVMAQDAQESAAGGYINGKQLEGVEPIVKDNRAYVPVRSIFESLGADVDVYKRQVYYLL